MVRTRCVSRVCALAATLGAVGLSILLSAAPAIGDNAPAPDRDRVIKALANFLEMPADRLQLQSARFEEHSISRPRPFYSCRCTVRSVDDNLIGRVYAEVEVKDYAVAAVQWLSQPLDALREIATEFVARHFPGWSDNMVLEAEAYEAERNSASFRWREKREGAWTGTFVAVDFYLDAHGGPRGYYAYIATPRSISDVPMSREEAVEKARQEALRRGLKNPRLHQTELYLDHHMRGFPHWVVTLDVDDPAYPDRHKPLGVGILVHGATGEIVNP